VPRRLRGTLCCKSSLLLKATMNKSLAASVAPDTTPAQMPPVLRAVISASRSAIASAAMFSLFLNLLMLVPSIYMLQVYDRVLSTGSVPTLLMLTDNHLPFYRFWWP